jgi:hypothetical protein
MQQPELSGDFANADGLGRQGPPPEGPHQCRDAGSTPAPRASSAPRASASAAPSTCSSTATASADARDDPGRGRRAAAPRSPSSCRCSARISSRAVRDHEAGLPVTIRLLDPPLHEFLPQDRGGGRGGRPSWRHAGQARHRAAALHEFNPMLGHRGCRLASPIPRSPRCRRAPSSRPPSRPAARHRQAGGPGDHGAAGRPWEGLDLRQGAHRRRWPRR